MVQVIIYKQEDNSVAIFSSGKDLQSFDLPNEHKIINRDQLPEYPFIGCLVYETVTVDMNKAREIAHNKRRVARAKEFQPWDDIIAKQIPGTDPVAAEAERQKIRDRYEQIQNDIDSAPGPAELKLIIDLLES